MVTTAGEYTWSAYFARQLDETNTVKPLPYLRKFIAEDIDNLAETVGKNRLTLTIWKFLQNMIDTNREEVKARLLSIIQKTRGKSMEETGLVGSNIAAMLIHLDPSALRSCDLSGVNLQGLRLSFENTEAEPSYHSDLLVDLSEVNLKNANLEHASFSGAEVTLEGANFQFSNLTGLHFPLKQWDDLSFHPLNKQLVISSSDDIILWDLASRKVQARVYTDGPWNVKYSPDGRYIVNSIWGGFEVRDAQTLEMISSHQTSKAVKKPKDNNFWTTAFAFSSDGKLLFVGSNDSAIYIWDFTRLQEVTALIGHTNHIDEISLSPDEKYLVGRSYSEIITWDLSTRSKVSERTWKGASLSSIMFHPKKMLIATVIPDEMAKKKKDLVDGKIHLLDPFTMETLDSFDIENAHKARFSPDGTSLCISNFDLLVVFDVSTKRQIFSIEFDKLSIPIYPSQRDLPGNIPGEGKFIGPYDLCFDATGQVIAVISHTGYIFLFDTKDMKVSDVFCHLPNLSRADFRHAIGIDIELQKQLITHSAIIEDDKC